MGNSVESEGRGHSGGSSSTEKSVDAEDTQDLFLVEYTVRTRFPVFLHTTRDKLREYVDGWKDLIQKSGGDVISAEISVACDPEKKPSNPPRKKRRIIIFRG